MSKKENSQKLRKNARGLSKEVPQDPGRYVDGRWIPENRLAVAGPNGKVGIFDPTTGYTQY